MSGGGIKRQLFLASASPRRLDILNAFQIPCTVIENKLVDETLNNNNIKKAVRVLAQEKALASKENYQGLILGVDTVVVINNQILGKPHNLDEAKKMLQKLSEKEHVVISGIAVVDTILNKNICRTEATYVKFKKLDLAEIEYYCSNYLVLDKAGAYAIQEYGQNFVKKIRGSYYNVVGLPIKTLKSILKSYKIEKI
ncbi:Maf family protein [Candidatus Margulisiibacteriota bacterium]